MAEKGLSGSMEAALAARNIIGPEAQAFMNTVMQMYENMKAGRGTMQFAPSSPAGEGLQVAGASQTEAPPGNKEGAGQRGGKEGAGIEAPRGGSRSHTSNREKSSSRSPRLVGAKSAGAATGKKDATEDL